MNKSEIYEQIRIFNKKRSNPDLANSALYEEAFLYVKEEVATERANFFLFLLQNTVLKDIDLNDSIILDLAFGSGSLVTHILLEGNLKYEKLILNDKITTRTNQNLVSFLDKAEVTALNFLEPESFPEIKAKVVVFNPQTGGNYPEGDSQLSQTVPVVYNGDLVDYLEENGKDTSKLAISKNDQEKEIFVYSEDLNVRDVENVLKGISVFNYYDVIYKTKRSQKTGGASNNVKFRKTFDKVFDSNGLLIFYGESEYFKALFADFVKYGHCIELCTNDLGKNLFLATKALKDGEYTYYKKSGDNYIIIASCKEAPGAADNPDRLEDLEAELSQVMRDITIGLNQEGPLQMAEKAPEYVPLNPQTTITLSTEVRGKLDFPYRNILLKGVPGTGKSRLLNKIVTDKLGLSVSDANVLRINVHSASSNADLMQGIGITTRENQVIYKEKQGLVLNHIRKAMRYPLQPFVIILEEIQENSLNELIGDLIYLIEDKKRASFLEEKEGNYEIKPGLEIEFAKEEDLLEAITRDGTTEFVLIPYLVEYTAENRHQKMIIPANLYVFCTSNYRDDKKIVEDNLLRRFELIELYPQHNETLFKNPAVARFLNKLNDSILSTFGGRETHPDRFMIGQAAWLDVETEQQFCRALLKTFTEFKDIREIEYSEFQPVLSAIEPAAWPFPELAAAKLIGTTYKETISTLQVLAYGELLNL